MFFIVTYFGKGRYHVVNDVFTQIIKTFSTRRQANQYAKGSIITPYKVFKYL